MKAWRWKMDEALVVSLMFVLLVLVEGGASFAEGTFYLGQSWKDEIKLPCILHGGVVIGDLFLIPLAIYNWYAFLQFSMLGIAVAVISAFSITWLCHRAWWFACEKQPGFMYPNRNKSQGDPHRWHWDLPLSAWIHFLYMMLAIIEIAGYIFSPMPKEIVWKTFWIFVIFVPFGVIEPGIVQGWPPTKKDIVNAMSVAVGLWIFLGLVTWVKLVHFQFYWRFIKLNL